MRLTIGPGNRRNDLVKPAKAAWETFVAEIGSLPMTCEPITFEAVGRSSSGTASAFVFIGPRYSAASELAMIVLAANFFEKTLNERTLTLLHECIHLRFMIGALRHRVVGSIVLNSAHRPPALLDQDVELFLDQRVGLAFGLRNFIDEIIAELYLKSEYPAFLPARITYYLEMRRGSLTLWQQAAPTLRPTALLHEILKNDLGALMADGRSERADFTAMSADLERQLRDLCDDSEFRRHMVLRERLMWATVDPLAYDDAAYWEAFTKTIALSR